MVACPGCAILPAAIAQTTIAFGVAGSAATQATKMAKANALALIGLTLGGFAATYLLMGEALQYVFAHEMSWIMAGTFVLVGILQHGGLKKIVSKEQTTWLEKGLPLIGVGLPLAVIQFNRSAIMGATAEGTVNPVMGFAAYIAGGILLKEMIDRGIKAFKGNKNKKSAEPAPAAAVPA